MDRGDVWPLLGGDGWLVSAHEGSQVAWFEFAAPGTPEAVVYDTRAPASRSAAHRVDVGGGGAWPCTYRGLGATLLVRRRRPRARGRRHAHGATTTPPRASRPRSPGRGSWRTWPASLARSVMVGTSDCDGCPALHQHRRDRPELVAGHGRLTAQGAQPLGRGGLAATSSPARHHPVPRRTASLADAVEGRRHRGVRVADARGDDPARVPPGHQGLRGRPARAPHSGARGRLSRPGTRWPSSSSGSRRPGTPGGT